MQNSTHMINFIQTQIWSSLTSESCAWLSSHLEKQSTQLLSEHYLQSRKVITLGDAGSSAASKGSLCILQTSRVTSCRSQTGSELSWFKFPRQILLTAPPLAGPSHSPRSSVHQNIIFSLKDTYHRQTSKEKNWNKNNHMEKKKNVKAWPQASY